MAKRLAGRYGYPEKPHEFDVTFHPNKLEEPLHWRKPRVVFPCSMSDWLHPNIPVEWQARMFGVMADRRCERHTFLLLTKRPENYGALSNYLCDGWQALKNGWHGVTVETQDQVWRVEQLLKIPGAKHWVNFEPLLGEIDASPYLVGKRVSREAQFIGDHGVMSYWQPPLDGVSVGGESGPGARPMNPDWARGIRDQCVAAGVLFTMKQWGLWHPAVWVTRDGDIAAIAAEHDKSEDVFGNGQYMMRFPNVDTGRVLDGKVWNQWPWDLVEGRDA